MYMYMHLFKYNVFPMRIMQAQLYSKYMYVGASTCSLSMYCSYMYMYVSTTHQTCTCKCTCNSITNQI